MAFQLKVLKSTPNPLLNRKELKLELTHTNQSTPDRKAVTEELSSHYSLPPKQIYVYNISTKPGMHKTHANASVYNSFDSLKAIERAFVVKRITGETEKVKVLRRIKKTARIKSYKRFGTNKRFMKKAARRSKD